MVRQSSPSIVINVSGDPTKPIYHPQPATPEAHGEFSNYINIWTNLAKHGSGLENRTRPRARPGSVLPDQLSKVTRVVRIQGSPVGILVFVTDESRQGTWALEHYHFWKVPNAALALREFFQSNDVVKKYWQANNMPFVSAAYRDTTT